MNEQAISQSSSGKASDQIHSSDHNLTFFTNRSISDIIAEDNRKLAEILSKSSRVYQVFEARYADPLDGNQNPKL